MSLLSSMYSAAAGLAAHGTAIDVVSDNIANVNTIGYKAARGRFEDVLGNTVANGALGSVPGQGSRLAGVEQMFTQGSMLGTGVATDMAIQGDGFFVVRGAYEGVDGTFYTRAGQLNLDANGQMVNPQGLVAQGYLADALGNIGGALTDLAVPATLAVPPRATAQAAIGANLDALSTIPAAFDPLNPGTTSNFSTSVVVYDSLGAAHNVDIYFRTSAPGTWEWHGLVDGGELAGGTPGVATEIASGGLTFLADGRLDTEVTLASSADFVGAVPGQVIAFDFGDSVTTDGGTGRMGSTSYAAPSNTTALTQDGYASGSLAGIVVEQTGIITGAFTNGERRTLGQVALASFRNNEGLLRAGAGLYVDSQASGNALVGTAGSGGRGSIVSGSLEQSTVDLAQEFVNLIAYQRGFQANSRTVRTADDMLTELMNMTR